MDLIDVPYLGELQRIRAFMEQQRVVKLAAPFPHGWCTTTARLVEHLLGLELVRGIYARGEYWGNHAVNYDARRGVFSDLTGDQFDPPLPPVCLSRRTDHEQIFWMTPQPEWYEGSTAQTLALAQEYARFVAPRGEAFCRREASPLELKLRRAHRERMASEYEAVLPTAACGTAAIVNL